MKKNLPISTDDFPTVIESCYFIDKSMFIAEVLGNMSESKLILRPRRFGKSLNMNMLKSFLEIGSPKALFDGLAVSKLTDLCEAHQGKYPVIFLTLKDMSADGFDEALEALSIRISDEADRLGIGNGCIELDTSENAVFDRMAEMQADKADVARSIQLMSKALYRRYGKKAIVLIDEYDAPINQACRMGYYDEMAGLLRGLLGQALESNPYIEFAVLIGILWLPKDSIFSEISSISVYTALDEEYSSHFGFSENEVAAMLSYYGLGDRMNDVKEYYDGYRMGSHKVYNPWSVVNACYDMIPEPGAELERHWANTASNSLVRDILRQDGFTALASIEDLVNGGTIETDASFMAAYRGLIGIPDSEALWGLMFIAGYLTWVSKLGDDAYELRAPNQEIRDALRQDALSWAKSAMPIDKGKADKLYEAMLAGNANEAEAVINELLEEVFSVRDGVVVHNDFAINKKDGHLIIDALLSCSFRWIVRSGAESGDGDIGMLCTNEAMSAAILIEEKFFATDGDAALLPKAEEAVGQIIAKRHSQAAQGYNTVVAVGIAYARTRCKIAIKQLR
ncbi:MAG: AAA family ATPase [Eubacteriaceae bacterium]|nr:AAA family ATPase [Eubacteriaceae bacterium]